MLELLQANFSKQVIVELITKNRYRFPIFFILNLKNTGNRYLLVDVVLIYVLKFLSYLE